MDFDKLSRKLEGLGKASRNGHKARNLHQIMRCPEIWQVAYANIYSNKGAMTQGIDDDTLDGMSIERISNIINNLKSGEYRPKPVRRIYIPKKDGKSRPLGVPSADDKLVQAVIKIMLEQIYEPVFHDSSHGFRPGKSCYTALNEIKHNWKSVKWLVGFDIKGCLDNINHDVLVELLEKRIDDKHLIKLIRAFLKAGYLENWKYNRTYSGTPQGSIISPILSNIYLHELDEFMTQYISRFEVGNRRPVNPEYNKVTKKIHRLRAKLRKEGSNSSSINALKELQSLQLTLPSSIEDTEEYKRLKYCRYADDFICGVIGSYKDAKALMQAVENFLRDNLKLQVSPKKAGIVRAEKGIDFLGYGIKAEHGDKTRKLKVYGNYCTKRTINGNILFSVPKHKIREFCRQKGYGNLQCKKSTHRAALLNCSEVEIVEMYNAELRGFVNYYAMARNVKNDLSLMAYLALQSLVKTLAVRRKTPVTQVFANLKRSNDYFLKYKVNGEWKEMRIFQLKHITKTVDLIDEIPLTEHLYRTGTELTRRMSAQVCEYCGRADKPVEVHHVRKLKDLTAKPHLENWEKIMIARNRKTLILCAGSADSCHNLLHKGKLPDTRHVTN